MPAIALPAMRATIAYSAPAAGGLAVVFHDTFTDTDTTQLSAHTPDIDTIGGGWTAPADWTISSNKAVNSTFTTRASIDTGVENYTVSAKISLQSTSSSHCRGILVRSNDANGETITTGYRVGLRYSANEFGIFDLANSAIASTPFTVTPGTEYTIEVTCSGATITATVDGGNEVSYGSADSTGRTQVGLINRYSGDTSDDFIVSA